MTPAAADRPHRGELARVIALPVPRDQLPPAEAGPHRHPSGRGRAAPSCGPAPTRPPRGAPAPATFAALLVRAATEVRAGRRGFAQLEPHLAPTLARRLAVALRSPGARPDAQLRIHRAFAAPPTPSGAIEATVLVERGGRVTAIAVRLERHRGTWRATEMTAPEAGFAPLATASAPAPRRVPDAFDEAEAEAEGLTAPVTRPRGSA